MSLIDPAYRSLIVPRRTPAVRLPGGYQTGNAVDIARRYSPNAAAFQNNLANISAVQPPSVRPPPRLAPTTTAAESTVDLPGQTAVDTAPVASMPPGGGVPPPQGNATQRWAQTKEDWKAGGGTNRTLNKANVERGVRPQIDGRATPDPKASTASADIRSQWGWPSKSTTDLPY